MRIVIVGASTAGLKCACHARRLLPGATITVLDARREISLAHGALPSFVAGEWPSIAALRTTTYGSVRDEAFFRAVKGLEVRSGRQVTAIDLAARTVSATETANGATETLPYDHLVLATGAVSRVPAGVVAGPAVHLGHDPLQLRDLRRRLERGEVDRLVLLGGGCVGVSLAAAVAETWGISVTLLEAADRLLPGVLDAELAAVAVRALRDLGVEVITDAMVTAVASTAAGAEVRIGAQVLMFDAAVVALGATANTAVARAAGLPVGTTGGLLVNEELACAPGVWACGDCVEVTHQLTGAPALPGRSGLATRMGRVVAERIAGRAAHFPPILGSFALRIGELVVATTGLTATAARAAGLTPAVAWGSFPDRAVLDPERKYDAVALVSEAGTGRLLGLQAVGPGAAVRRADVLATQLRRGAHLDDLFDLEPCCHPATGDLLDPLPHLAALAVAEATGGPRAVATEWAAGDALLLDVREVSEMDGERPPIPGALNIPLGELADRCGEIPRDRPVVVYCARGPRSFEAVSLLLSKEFFNAFYLAGGVGLRQSR